MKDSKICDFFLISFVLYENSSKQAVQTIVNKCREITSIIPTLNLLNAHILSQLPIPDGNKPVLASLVDQTLEIEGLLI